MTTPVYIPSKGRAGRASAIDLFIRIGVQPVVFVEPQEVELYHNTYPAAFIVNIRESDRGMAFVRNFMLRYAGDHGHHWCWQIDDDINSFHWRGEWEVKRVTRVPENLIDSKLGFAEHRLRMIANLAYACLQWRNTAWCASKVTTLNRKCGLVTLCNTSLMRKFAFRGVLRSDIDMSMQLLAKGYRTATYNRLAFAAPGCGLNRIGGLSRQYDLGSTERAAVRDFVDRWKPWASLRTTSAGRPDVTITWDKFLRDHEHPDAKA